MAYPDPRRALAAERIADLQRAAARRRTVLAALRARPQLLAAVRREVARRCIVLAVIRAHRRRRAALAALRAPARSIAPSEHLAEHLCDDDALAADARSIAQAEMR